MPFLLFALSVPFSISVSGAVSFSLLHTHLPARSLCLYRSLYLSLALILFLSVTVCFILSPFLCLSVSLSLYIFISLSLCFCLPMSVSFCLSVSLWLCLCVSVSMCISVSLCVFVSLSLSPSIPISLCLSLSLSFCIYVSAEQQPPSDTLTAFSGIQCPHPPCTSDSSTNYHLLIPLGPHLCASSYLLFKLLLLRSIPSSSSSSLSSSSPSFPQINILLSYTSSALVFFIPIAIFIIRLSIYILSPPLSHLIDLLPVPSRPPPFPLLLSFYSPYISSLPVS